MSFCPPCSASPDRKGDVYPGATRIQERGRGTDRLVSPSRTIARSAAGISYLLPSSNSSRRQVAGCRVAEISTLRHRLRQDRCPDSASFTRAQPHEVAAPRSTPCTCPHPMRLPRLHACALRALRFPTYLPHSSTPHHCGSAPPASTSPLNCLAAPWRHPGGTLVAHPCLRRPCDALLLKMIDTVMQ